MPIKKLMLFCFSLCYSLQLFAHGLIESPASRNWICGAITKPDQVLNGTAQYPECGTAFAVNSLAGYSFMSVLTHALGRSSVSPLPTNVCSFGSETWNGAATPWDTPMNWPTQPMGSGKQTISWNISWGPHFDDTAEFRYWITKPDFQFSSTKALTWDDFETTPFCVLNYDDKNPTANPNVTSDKATARFHTQCVIPTRNGHHVIYGEWGRKPPTYERFHSCIDAAFGGTHQDPVVASISATPAASTITGTNTISFSAAGSQGTDLSYRWSIDSTNPSLYQLSSTSGPSTTLSLQNPEAETLFTVRLTVSNQDKSNSASLTFTHLPSIASHWTDLGALTTTSRTMAMGSLVRLRLVDSNGQDAYLPANPLAISAANADASQWPYALAQAINAANGNVQIGVLNNELITPIQNATGNRIYAETPSDYVSAYLIITAPGSSSSAASVTSNSSSASSRNITGERCNWYGTRYPLCVTTQSGWGWENNENCIAATTCAAQPAPYGIESNTSSRTATSSSTRSSSISSMASSSTSRSATGEQCKYTITNEWNTGFTATISIYNNTSQVINGWTLAWKYTDGTKITNSWNTLLSGTTPYSATGLNWNSTIQPGATVELGFQGMKGASSNAQVPAITGSVCQ